MSKKIAIVSAADENWDDLLRRVPHDIYHTRAYHTSASFGVIDHASKNQSHQNGACSSSPGSSGSFLFCYQQDDLCFLFPYLLRSLDDISGAAGSGLFDITSAYGYGGPLASPNASGEFLGRAWRELLETWRAHRAISAFTRFHPLLQNVRLADNASGASSIFDGSPSVSSGTTVSIDLRKDEAQQVRDYQKNLRQEIRRSYELGFQVCPADLVSNADLFVELYMQTMERRHASEQYRIDRKWVLRFSAALGPYCSLLVARLENDIAAALLVMECNGFVHAHLTGIAERFTASSPLKPLLDGTRKWAKARGNHTFHLGGGIGGRQDTLFQFKRHFSPQTHPFHIGCWILNREIYTELSGHSSDQAPIALGECGESKPFPAYRFPAAAGAGFTAQPS